MDESKMTRPAPRLAGTVGRDDSGASLQFFETLWVSPGGRKTNTASRATGTDYFHSDPYYSIETRATENHLFNGLDFNQLSI